MQYCWFYKSPCCDKDRCVICGRIVSSKTMFELRLDSVRLACGVPSVFDENEKQSINRINELIGQEGGRFDYLYTEEGDYV